METKRDELSVKGKVIEVPSTFVNGRRVIVTGSWVRMASVKDEDLVEGEAVDQPDIFVETLRNGELKADIFTFAQSPTNAEPKHHYRMEWDNAAVIPLSSYKDWWEKRLPQETRRNVRKAAKLGVIVREIEFNDDLVRGIMEIYNETPIRQGRSFLHYGKNFETVKKENATYLGRCEFLGAFYSNELIGFIKMVYVGETASIMQILSKNAHQDKKPSNALIAKAVELSEKRGMSYLLYCKYSYGGQTKSPLTEFKRRNGFEKMSYPRYFIALTVKGAIVLKLGLHCGLSGLLPENLRAFARAVRSRLFEAAKRRRLARSERSCV
jgi:hypothetical protein